MDSNGIVNSTGLGIAFIILLVFGIAYNSMVERFQKRSQRYTAELVAFGVIVTVTISGFFIGWNNMAVVLILFTASGLPMIVGSWLRSVRDDEEAKKTTKEFLR
ncbi:MAG TPA: hypothetical protein VFC02_10040 [Anaerolineales bacterium]|nr:hypothetical protein [Anaerolineales bacterium]